MGFRGAPPDQGGFDDGDYVDVELDEDQLDEKLAGHNVSATSWHSWFGKWGIGFGIAINILEVCSSTGGLIYMGLLTAGKAAGIGGINDVQVFLGIVLHDFPLMFVFAIACALSFQTALHYLVQPMQITFQKVLTVAQKKRLWSHIEDHASFTNMICTAGVLANVVTDFAFIYVTFGSWILALVVCLVFPAMSTQILYKGLASNEGAKSEQALKVAVQEIELQMYREQFGAHLGGEVFGND